MAVADGLEKVREALAGRYDIERQLGAGGMAIVYLARDVARDRTVAVKVLRPEIAVALGGDRFLREIKVAGNLHHPNILPVYDSGDIGGVLFFVMPYVTGESLRDRLDREGQLAIDEAVRVTREVGEGIQHAHNHGIVHRDIKPENVLLEGGHAIVADFGIARAVGESGGQKLTETGMSVGTPTYMSPEQAAGGERLDGRSDQYSLACMLYEMLAGHPPFTGGNSMAILAKHAMETPPSLQVVRQSVPDEVEDAIMRGLEKTPADRFPSVKDFAEALGDVASATAARRAMIRTGAHPTGRRGTPTRGVPVTTPRPRTKLIAIAAAALLLVGGGSWVAWKQLTKGGGEAAPAGPDPKRIAVMYFDSRGGDSLKFLADGLTEALISQLSQVEPLEVISRNGVSALRGAAPDSVARALNVGTLVQGSVAQAGDLLRVTVSMLDAEGRELRGSSKTIDRPRGEVFALQDTLATEVAAFLRTRVGQEVELRASRAGTRNAAAWEALQRAREAEQRVDPLVASGDTGAVRRQFELTDSLFAAAGGVDPRWAAPHSDRGWLAYKRMRMAGDRTEAASLIDRGLQHAEAALQRTPTHADALELRATLVYFRWLLGLEPDQAKADQLLVSAERDYRASIEANPAQASALTSLSHLLANKGRVAEAQVLAASAYEKDPYLVAANTTLWRLFTTSLDLEDEQNATRWCREGQRRFPEDARFVECQIWTFALKSVEPDVPRVWQLLDEYVELSPPELKEVRRLHGQMLVAIALVRANLPDSALAVIGRSQATDPDLDPTRDLAYLEAIAHTLLGNRDKAFELLAQVVAVSPAQRRGFAVDQTWWFRDLRQDPRYRDLMGSPS